MSLFSEIDIEVADTSPSSFIDARSSWLSALRAEALRMQNDPEMDLTQADIRYSTSINLRGMRNDLIAIVGLGGIGNWQLNILSTMGFKRLAVFDDDTVGIENVGSQAHSIFDIGLLKVEAAANSVLSRRAFAIQAYNIRVNSMLDILANTGEVPRFLILCSDDREFRNSMLSYKMFADPDLAPEFILDFRMSLGDWCCFAIPAKMLCLYGAQRITMKKLLEEKAILQADNVVQEPCTARAISYTGANAASFTGAFMHWYYSGDTARDEEWLSKFVHSKLAFPRPYTAFSARDFEYITSTPRTEALEKQCNRIQIKLNEVRQEFDDAFDLIKEETCIPIDAVYKGVSSSISDWECEENKITYFLDPVTRKVYIRNSNTERVYLLTSSCPELAENVEEVAGKFLIYSMPLDWFDHPLHSLLTSAKPGTVFYINVLDTNRFKRVSRFVMLDTETNVKCLSARNYYADIMFDNESWVSFQDEDGSFTRALGPGAADAKLPQLITVDDFDKYRVVADENFSSVWVVTRLDAANDKVILTSLTSCIFGTYTIDSLENRKFYGVE